MHHGYRHITIVSTAAMHTPLPVWVKSVGSTRPTISRHVRCASDSFRIGALQRFDEECHFRTHAAQQSAPYSMTSSAVASRVGGTSRPSDLAVLRLITSWKLVGC
jgi:hypothetical protein